MKVIAVLIIISTITTICAFAPSRSIRYNNVGRTQSSALDLFNFKAKEASSVATTSGGDITAAKKKFDGILKKNSKLILMISGTAKDGIKAKNLFEDKGVKYTAIELDRETDGKQLRTAISESIGTKTPAIWIRGQFIGDFNALNKLNTNGELDTLIKFIPSTTHKSPR